MSIFRFPVMTALVVGAFAFRIYFREFIFAILTNKGV
jgi:hypothetical protein